MIRTSGANCYLRSGWLLFSGAERTLTRFANSNRNLISSCYILELETKIKEWRTRRSLQGDKIARVLRFIRTERDPGVNIQ
jgi:hypothetical protein